MHVGKVTGHKGVTPEVNLRGTYIMYATAKTEETSAVVRNMAISGPNNGHMSNKNFKKSSDKHLTQCGHIRQNEVQNEKLDRVEKELA